MFRFKSLCLEGPVAVHQQEPSKAQGSNEAGWRGIKEPRPPPPANPAAARRIARAKLCFCLPLNSVTASRWSRTTLFYLLPWLSDGVVVQHPLSPTDTHTERHAHPWGSSLICCGKKACKVALCRNHSLRGHFHKHTAGRLDKYKGGWLHGWVIGWMVRRLHSWTVGLFGRMVKKGWKVGWLDS